MKNAKTIVEEFQKALKENAHIGLAVGASLNDGQDCGFYVAANNKYNLLALVANVIVHSSATFEVTPAQMLELVKGFIEKEMPEENSLDALDSADTVWVLKERN